MKTGKPPDPFLLALYRSSLRLYPWRLRLLYQDQLLQTARDAHADSNSNLCFWSSLFADLLKSAVKEQLLMIREQLLARPIFFHALIIGLILTLMGGSAAATFQQMLRRGANQPQIQMAASYAAEIASGVKPEQAIPRNNIDLDRSLEPFAIFYNDRGMPTTSNGQLNQSIPSPPRGVFNYLRSHDTDTVTWQPQSNVRIAAVIRRVSARLPVLFWQADPSAWWKSRKVCFGGWSFSDGSCWSFFSSPAPRSSAAASNIAFRCRPRAFARGRKTLARERGESQTCGSASYRECAPSAQLRCGYRAA